MEPEDEVLLNLVNGKRVEIHDLLFLISIGYLVASPKAIAKLHELKGAIHELNPHMVGVNGTDGNNTTSS